MCVDPATAALIVSTAAAAGQGIASYAQGQAQAAGLRSAASQAVMSSAVEETNIRRQSREFLARQRVQALGTGADISSGSLAEVAEADAATLELNALMRRYEGKVESENLRFQARQAKRAGEVGLATGLLSAGAQALGGMSKFPGMGSGSGSLGTAGRGSSQLATRTASMIRAGGAG